MPGINETINCHPDSHYKENFKLQADRLREQEKARNDDYFLKFTIIQAHLCKALWSELEDVDRDEMVWNLKTAISALAELQAGLNI